MSLLPSWGGVCDPVADLIHKLRVLFPPTAQSCLVTEEITYFLSCGNSSLLILLPSSLQKHGNFSQHWRTKDFRPVKELRVCLWEGSAACLIYYACDMGPVGGEGVPPGRRVFTCYLWNCVYSGHVLWTHPGLGWSDENTVVRELFPPRSWGLRGTHISGSGLAFGDSSVLGTAVSSEFSHLFRVYLTLKALSVNSCVPWSPRAPVTLP